MADKNGITLSSFKPQRKNPNKHTARGSYMVEKSMQTDGFLGAITAAADGETIAGSLRLEKAAEVFGPEALPIVVESDGTRPVIVKRTDIPNADDPRAKRLSVADNRTAEVDLAYDPEVIQEWSDEGILDDLFFPHELDGIEASADIPRFDADPADGREKLGQVPIAKMVVAVNDMAMIETAMRETGEKSRMNALAKICKFYLDNDEKRQFDALR